MFTSARLVTSATSCRPSGRKIREKDGDPLEAFKLWREIIDLENCGKKAGASHYKRWSKAFLRVDWNVFGLREADVGGNVTQLFKKKNK